MISKTLRTTDGQMVIAIPSQLSELTLGMFIAMQEDNTDLETISILSGMPKDELYNVRNLNEFELFREHVLSLVHQINYESHNLPIPKSIFIMGKSVRIIDNLSIEPVGAFMVCRDVIADEINAHKKVFGEKEWDDYFEANGNIPVDYKPSVKAGAKILAHYLYCKTTGLPYDEDKANVFEKEILKLSMVLTIPIAKYFFLSYPDLWREKQSFSKVVIQLWKKRLALNRSRRSNTSIL